MSGFRKAKPEQAALKVGLYGPPGSGKTLTSLLCAEGLAQRTGKRVAFVDTERGTDFYAQEVKEREVHPEAFDFDALYTRSITDISRAVQDLDPARYGVVVLDSITHVWEAARLAYAGRETKIGTIPFHAWAKIKKPYKDLMAFLLSSPLHVFILGRQGNEFEEDEESGEMKKVGVKMKAEGETAYEPHILLRMEAVKDQRTGRSTITAFAEKDRTGILAGKTFASPTFDALIRPILPLLGDKQAVMDSEDATAAKDAEQLAISDDQRRTMSAQHLRIFSGRFDLETTKDGVAKVAKEITAEIKKQMTPADLEELRERWKAAEKRVNA